MRFSASVVALSYFLCAGGGGGGGIRSCENILQGLSAAGGRVMVRLGID